MKNFYTQKETRPVTAANQKSNYSTPTPTPKGHKMNKAIKIAICITLTLWLAGSIGCSTLERFSQGLHEDIKSYNDGNAARREQR